MKTRLSTGLLCLVLTLFASCIGKGVICTQEYRMITVQVQNAQGQAVTPDEVFTIRQSTGEKISYPHNMGPGYYTVLEDSYQPVLSKKRDVFVLVGKKAGAKLFEEPYEVSADRCHINKISGKDIIVVP